MNPLDQEEQQIDVQLRPSGATRPRSVVAGFSAGVHPHLRAWDHAMDHRRHPLQAGIGPRSSQLQQRSMSVKLFRETTQSQ
jgi:hypothetical protein